MAQIEIISERETPGGWEFTAQILADDGGLSSHQIRLAWADYNLWSIGGADEPAKVIDGVLGFLLTRAAASEIPEKFDAAVVRRRYADADKAIPPMIGR